MRDDSNNTNLIRITTRIAATVAAAVTLTMPLGYFAVSYQYMVGSLETESEVSAYNISKVISANPELWRYEKVRLDELLVRRSRAGHAETRRIIDNQGNLVAESVNSLIPPVIKRSYVLKDAGADVGKIEIYRSLNPILLRTGLVSFLGFVLGMTVFITLRVLPKRAIYDLKRAEEKLHRYARELKESNEDLKNFAYIVSHDLRAPLVNIKGFAGELSAGLKELEVIKESGVCCFEGNDGERVDEILGTDVPEALDFINSSVNRMDALINSILKLSRLGHRELKPEPVDVKELVATILKTLTHQLEQRNAEVVVGALPELVADRTSLEQILGNLLDNAVKYFDPQRPGRLEIRAESGADEIVFHLRDNGRGISRDDTQKVFEIFRRAGKQDVRGDGMGLAYVKTLVRRLGGRIWCASELGVGTTFSFSIPKSDRLLGNERGDFAL